ncbi:MAG: caspase family protein [Balneolaceae bacterium]|nr:caspase family protein [Balneolaceae bacterium]
MKHYSTYGLVFCLLLLAAGCTNPRWMVKESHSVDNSDFRVLTSREFPAIARPPTPEEPVLDLQIMSRPTNEYAEKVLMERYVQDYKIRPLFFTFGIAGAATAFYLANSNSVKQVDGRLETVALNGIGGLLTIATAFNFQSSGEPRPTGEERYLRTTGYDIRTDTTRVTASLQDSAYVTVRYGEREISERQRFEISGGALRVDLGTALSSANITDIAPDSVEITIGYSDSTFAFAFPLESILRPFARVETPTTELRNAPVDSTENILADLVEGSQLQIVERVEENWYKVLYGISENYVSRDDVSLVWRTSDFAQQNQVVAVPSVPFGRIDVENNIPILNYYNPNGVALIIGNEEYKGSYDTRTYTGRDLKLLETYIDDALGYPDRNIFKLENIRSRKRLDSVLALMRQTVTDSSEIFVYISGYGTMIQQEEDHRPAYLFSPGDDQQDPLDLISLYQAVAAFPARQTVVVSHIDFSRSVQESGAGNLPLQTFSQPLYNSAITLANENDGLALLISSEPDQSTHTYFGGEQNDKKHHIFPYYFARALQQRRTKLSDIFEFLQRNVSYTARKLHDEPEDPMIFGNQTIDLAGE